MMRRILIACACLVALLGAAYLWLAPAPPDPTLQPEFDAARASAPPPPRSARPRSEERSVFFGDLHIHTRLSLDAYRFGVTAGPEDAYVFAKGGTIEHGAGYPIRLTEPLDFAAVTDHAEFLGMLDGMQTELPLSNGALRETLLKRNRFSASWLFIKTMMGFQPPAQGNQGYEGDPVIMRAAWARTIAAAEKANDPGVFTTFVAYEWSSSSVPDKHNLHRNVIYRDSRAPEIPFSALDSKDPEDLWDALEAQLESGAEAIAIPHNANVSNGNMWSDLTFEGEPIDARYAARRNRWEPLAEIFQVKGQSETHPALSTEDEFADFEIKERSLNFARTPVEPRGGYAREALLRGLQYQVRAGFDPFDFGVIGSSDGHGASSPIEEDAFHGKLPLMDGTAGIRLGTSTLFPRDELPASEWGSGGVAAIWAEENTRESLFAAMRRRETYATSGTRIRLRFFAGSDYPKDLFERADGIRLAYQKGVAMGSALPVPSNGSPWLAVWALRDPRGANLDRLQIIKLWVDASGKAHERIFDVAASDGRIPDAETQRVGPVGNTVDVQGARYENTIGASELKVVWQDPAFDPRHATRYYARAIEIPTPRWTTYDARALGIEAPEPTTLQERAVSSAITIRPRTFAESD